MKIAEIFSRKKTVFSLEVFPPKRTAAVDSVYSALRELGKLHPNFISVTYGAGGCENSRATFEIAVAIKRLYVTEGVAHLPCIGLRREEVEALLDELSALGIENVLALRGDRPKDRPVAKGDFEHASDLIRFIRDSGRNFNVSAACHPEGHSEAPSLEADIENLKLKVDAGTDNLISQLFFDNEYFFRFLERSRRAGISVPIEAGIMPVINSAQIRRMTSLCGATLPRKFLSAMERFERNPEAMRDAGIAYAVDQIADLVAHGVDGIHLYTMNTPYVATKVYEAVHSLVNLD